MTGKAAIRKMTYAASVHKMLSAADWLDDTDAPAVMALIHTAEALDSGGTQAALLSQFRLLLKEIMARRPAADGVDPLDLALGQAQQ